MKVESICGMEEPLHYRNKAQFPIGRDKNGKIIAGFYAGRTHSIIANTDCLLGAEENEAILNEVISWMEACKVEPYDEKTGKGLVRHVLIRKGFTTKELMVCLVINGKKIPQAEKLAAGLQKIDGMTAIMANVNTEQTNVILGKEILPIWGQDYIEDYIGNVKYRISPLSFYQVNPVQTEKLYGKALEYAGLTGRETVWDLYCGIGTISLFLAQKAKQVYGVEIVPSAIEDAKDNARRNGIKNAEFYVGKAEEILPQKYETENIKADVIVVDPPRKGCDEALLETIVKMQPERVVYVSCDSATLARDLKYLAANGYKAECLATVDMFPMTVHVETVCLLGREIVNDKNVEYAHVDYEPKDAEYLKSAKGSASYREIKEWIKEQHDVSVSNLYIAQVKDKSGFEKRENYNKGADGHRVPNCPAEKEKLILEAFKHFRMI